MAPSPCSGEGRSASGGEKVFPEVEEAIKTHDVVHDAVAVGVPDEKFGQAVTVVVELQPGSTLDAAELIAHVKGLLAVTRHPANAHRGHHRPRRKRQKAALQAPHPLRGRGARARGVSRDRGSCPWCVPSSARSTWSGRPPVVGAWPMAVVAVAVRRNLGRPVFFRQVRPGLDGRPFTLVGSHDA